MSELTGDPVADLHLKLSRGIMRMLKLGDQQVKCVTDARYIPGQPDFVIQISDGDDSPEGSEGGQAGNILKRRVGIKFSLFQRVMMDQFGEARDALYEAGLGLVIRSAKLRQLLRVVKLDEIVGSSFYWQGTTGGAWVFEEQGQVIAQKTMIFSCVIAGEQATAVTLSEEDCK